jgi:hypothetical protein
MNDDFTLLFLLSHYHSLFSVGLFTLSMFASYSSLK